MVLCGDFNARCGGLRDVDGEMVDRCKVDMVKNEQEEMLVECMKGTGLYALSMVDRGQMSLLASPAKDNLWLTTAWCHVKRLLALRTSYVVRTMSQCEAHLCTSEEGLRIPDHSVLMWDLWVDDSMSNLTETPGKEAGSDAHKKYVALEGYMVGERIY